MSQGTPLLHALQLAIEDTRGQFANYSLMTGYPLGLVPGLNNQVLFNVAVEPGVSLQVSLRVNDTRPLPDDPLPTASWSGALVPLRRVRRRFGRGEAPELGGDRRAMEVSP